MTDIDIHAPGRVELLLGNEAIARGALEAGVGFISGYPGTPSSEIIPTIAEVAKRNNIYAEWAARCQVPPWEQVFVLERDRVRAYEQKLGRPRVWDTSRPVW